MFEYRLEHTMSYNATLAEPEVIRLGPEGIRVNFHVTGGIINGPKVFGKLRSARSDWLQLSHDGVSNLDVRATAEPNDGALLHITDGGTIDVGENGCEAFLKGVLPSDGTTIRTAPQGCTSQPDSLWPNRLQWIGVGQAFLSRLEVAYDVHAVR